MLGKAEYWNNQNFEWKKELPGLVRSLFLVQVKIIFSYVWLARCTTFLEGVLSVASGTAAIYIVGPHTHRDTDAQTMRNTAAYYGKDAACVL